MKSKVPNRANRIALARYRSRHFIRQSTALKQMPIYNGVLRHLGNPRDRANFKTALGKRPSIAARKKRAAQRYNFINRKRSFANNYRVDRQFAHHTAGQLTALRRFNFGTRRGDRGGGPYYKRNGKWHSF